VAAICVLAIEAVVHARKAAFEGARLNASNVSAAFEEQVRSTLAFVSGASDLIVNRIRTHEPVDLPRLRADVPKLLGPAINVTVVGADGRVVATTLSNDARAIDLSDRDYFLAHRDNPALGLVVGKPVEGKIAKRVVLPIARRLTSENGSFAGVVVFSIDPRLLTGLHREVNLGQAGTLTLMSKSGQVLARYTSTSGFDAASMGQPMPEILEGIGATAAETGSFIRKSPVDDVERIYSWRAVPDFPLIAVVGLGKAESIAAANYQARIVFGIGIVALSLPLIMMTILNRQIAQRIRDSLALDAESDRVRQEHTALLTITEELARERVKLRKTNEELATAKARAEEASHAKSAFLANMSHELRTPLNAILGFSEIIRDRLFGDDIERYSAYASDINRSGTHLLSVVNAVLDVTKIEAGKLDLMEEQVDLEDLLDEVLLAVEQQARKSALRLSSSLPDHAVSVYGDRTKLLQILINLLSNAIKFTPTGGQVALNAVLRDDRGLDLSVRDTGIGMSAADIEKALEIFNQVDSCLSKRFEGAGLGLPLAVKLSELHGGTLSVESALGEGTLVTLSLPSSRVSVRDREIRRNIHAGFRRAYKIAS
jgi:signal transduction histidine kinase